MGSVSTMTCELPGGKPFLDALKNEVDVDIFLFLLMALTIAPRHGLLKLDLVLAGNSSQVLVAEEAI